MAKGTKKKETLTPEEKLQQALVPVEEQPYPVPENWCWVYGLGFLEQMETKKPTGDYFKYIDIDAIDNKRQIVSKPKVLPVNEAPSRASRYLHEGDTVFSMVRPYLKNIAYIDKSIADSIASTGFYVCTPRKNVNKRYCYFLMTSPYVIGGLNSFMKGDNSPSIRKEELEHFPYPLSPLPEQQRIVARIESLFAKLDEVKEKAQAIVDGYEDRKAAILHKAFTGELTVKWREEKGIDYNSWKKEQFANVTINLDHKRIPLSKAERANLTKIYDYYGASGIIDKVDKFIFDGRYLLIGEDGANLVMRSKPIAFIAEGKFWVNNHAHIIETKSDITIDFLCFFINSIDLIPFVTGSAQPKMTQAKMNTIPVPVPTIQEQKRIVSLISETLNNEETVKSIAQSVLDQIDTMKKSILARAFRGELGTNDPADEPAVELLKKVLEEEK